MTSQRQQGGDRSVNLQGETVIYQSGITVSDARDIAEDVFKANALELAGIAKEVATARCQEWSALFLSRLSQESPDLLGKLVDPDIQYALFSAQKNFARSGDQVLGHALIDLLVKRCQVDARSLEKLVLNEAIETVPKLTHGQVAILTVIWSLTRTYEPATLSPSHLATEWARRIGPLVPEMSGSRANLEHLSYAGCLTMGTVLYGSIWEIVMRTYGQLFCTGITLQAVPVPLRTYWDDSRFFKNFSDDGSLKRVSQPSEMPTGPDALPYELEYELESLRKGTYPSPDELVDIMSEDYPSFSDLCAVWDASQMGSSSLSSVGIAIGYSNWARLYGQDEELGVWIS